MISPQLNNQDYTQFEEKAPEWNQDDFKQLELLSEERTLLQRQSII